MNTTMAEALERFCPELMGGGTRVATVTCKGSKCMAWRWSHEVVRRSRRSVGPDRRPDHLPDDWVYVPADLEAATMWVEPVESAELRSRGYCGLAGEPRDL